MEYAEILSEKIYQRMLRNPKDISKVSIYQDSDNYYVKFHFKSGFTPVSAFQDNVYASKEKAEEIASYLAKQFNVTVHTFYSK